ncbi:unnamed protein product [Prorocentrum cordatum]|uniref:Uncharacterized protein n=1 Tax=Prorocentrum cordatum TaxID=2364126 RepID=A0ABN9X6V2_9DINO|nr:unnamed protein product [Polarella glacialis]
MLLSSGGAARPSRLERVLWMNLDRRQDRAESQLAALALAGLGGLQERVSAVDGRILDVAGISTDILTAEGAKQALAPPREVRGMALTPGAVGLWLTWHGVLLRLAQGPADSGCCLVVEDDAAYVDGFLRKLGAVLEALDSFDPRWDVCAVGYIRSKSFSEPLVGDLPKEGPSGPEPAIARVARLCGASALLIRGPAAAERMLGVLFPVPPSSQWDLRLNFSGGPDGRLSMFMSADPLAAAPLSEAGDTDIQRLPEGRREELELEAHIRHALCDGVRPRMPAIARAESDQQALARALAAMDGAARDRARRALAPGGCAEAEVAELVRELETAVAACRGPPPRRRRAAWSVADRFSVSSWSNWRETHELLPFNRRQVRHPLDGARVQRAKVRVHPGCVEEFQILIDSDRARRFVPAPSGNSSWVCGPSTGVDGRNFRVDVPFGCDQMWIYWDPTGPRYVTTEVAK